MYKRPSSPPLILLLAWVIVFFAKPAQADFAPYDRTQDIKTSFGDQTIQHYHNWSSPNRMLIAELLQKNQDIFSAQNTTAHIALFDKEGKQLWKHPSPPLTHIYTAPDNRYIIGLSTIKLFNPYQLAIWDAKGTLLHAEHISSTEACYNEKEWNTFLETYPKAKKRLEGCVTHRSENIYVDYIVHALHTQVEAEALQSLHQHMCPSHYSQSFRESVSNTISWFHPQAPIVEITPKEIRIRDPEGVVFSIPIDAQEKMAPYTPCSDRR